jgi:hypothetical protein
MLYNQLRLDEENLQVGLVISGIPFGILRVGPLRLGGKLLLVGLQLLEQEF